MMAKPTPKPSVLIVDDEPEFARLLAAKLLTAGFRTVVSAKVTEAIQKLMNQKFGCILLDLHLEQGSGERVVDVLRGDVNLPNFKTPILVMSGHLDARVIQRLGPRINGVFVKPLDSAKLLERIVTLTAATPPELAPAG
jgi:CheY-like chemotaxis protein